MSPGLSTILPSLALFFSVLALIFGIAANHRASERFSSSVLTRKLRDLQVEVLDLQTEVNRVHKMYKAAVSRQNLEKAREKRHAPNGGSMSDEEWRRWATQRAQQGLPIE